MLVVFERQCQSSMMIAKFYEGVSGVSDKRGGDKCGGASEHLIYPSQNSPIEWRKKYNELRVSCIYIFTLQIVVTNVKL